jgi:hypothetical protein
MRLLIVNNIPCEKVKRVMQLLGADFETINARELYPHLRNDSPAKYEITISRETNPEVPLLRPRRK